MDKFISSIRSLKNRLNPCKIPEKHVNDYKKLTLLHNNSREKTATFALIILNIFLMLTDYFVYVNKWSKIPAYKSLFLLHILAILVLSPYYYFGYYRKSKSCIINKKRQVLFHRVSIFFVLVWCVLIALNDQYIDGQISVYVIGISCASALLILTPLEAFFIFFPICILFVSCLVIFQNQSHLVIGNVINASVMTVLAYMVSRIRYISHVNNFINERIILEKTIELNKSNKKLEIAIDKRTEELNKANELLIHEINVKHDLELQAMKANLLYEEKKNELSRAMEHEKLRTAFFANISHELRTPLNLVFSAEQMIEKYIESENTLPTMRSIKKFSKIIKQNCYRLIRIINNLIDITKIDAGYFEICLGNHNIVELVESIAMSIVDYTQSKNINLTFDTDQEEKIIACDPDKIERIMLNLLSNAIKFTPKNGSIYVNIHCNEKYVSISVKDTGIGIPAEMQSAVFDKFVQVDNSSTRVTEGSGIGLSLVKSLVDMHGGEIHLNSKYGKGSEFIIKLPDVTVSSKECSDNKLSSGNSQNIELIHVEFSDIYINN